MDHRVDKAKLGDLPHDVRLVATVARLLDLHNSRRDRGSRSTTVTQQPQVSADAGYYLWLGLQAIQLLHRDAKRGSSGPMPIGRLHEELSGTIGQVARSDLDYCLSFLSLEREIRYLDPSSLPAEETRVTQTPTQLLRFDKRFGQVRLSDAGRLLMRISALHQDWLYEDKDVERIPASIERGVFEDIRSKPSRRRSSTMSAVSRSAAIGRALMLSAPARSGTTILGRAAKRARACAAPRVTYVPEGGTKSVSRTAQGCRQCRRSAYRACRSQPGVSHQAAESGRLAAGVSP